ncbi:MAG TPA: hypothetical protein VN805_13290 [Caulobacteraceae bacterium]|nr:hypothetical protein [Caulobacteraceae bacterium]
MQRRLRRALGLGSTLAIVGIASWLAVSTATPGRAADQPGLGDLMNASLQTHHAKLWFAGHADNWALAAFEVKEMKETTALMENVFPMWHNLNVGVMVTVLDSSLNELDQAIAAKDPVKFDDAYHDLTNACNACHTAANQAEIKIVDPIPQGAGSFADQDFTNGSGPQ